MKTKTVSAAAAVLVGLEGVALAALVVWQIVVIIGGDTASLASALALVVLTGIGAAGVLAFASGIWRGLSWGRSGAVVAQVLILAVALGAVTGAYGHPLTALALAVPAVVVLVLLAVATRGAAMDRSGSEDGPDGVTSPTN